MNTRYVALCVLGILVLSSVIPVVDGLSVLGFVKDKTYLVILQDNDELRNTGGTIACVGLLTLHNGDVKSLQVFYAPQATTNEFITVDGPESFTQFFGTSYVRLFEANVQYDFATFAPFFSPPTPTSPDSRSTG